MTEQRTYFSERQIPKKKEGKFIGKRDLKRHFKHILMFYFYVDHYSHKPTANILLMSQSGKFLQWHLMRLRNVINF